MILLVLKKFLETVEKEENNLLFPLTQHDTDAEFGQNSHTKIRAYSDLTYKHREK